MSLGVCLPGGGAKGAFQAGVLEALYDRGIKKYDSYNDLQSYKVFLS